MPSQAARALLLAALFVVSHLQLAHGEAWRDNPEWFAREKTLSSGLRAGEAVQHLEYKSFFTRHVIVECFEGFEGFSIGLGWAEISIDRALPVLYTVDGLQPRVVPKSQYNDEHFVQVPEDVERSIELVAGFIKGLEVAFWTKDRGNIEFEHPYSLAGFSSALEKGCGWHPSVAAAREKAKKIKY